MTTLRYEIEVTTPLFCAGADQEKGPAELRPPSLRGAMRFWFRAMMGAVVNGDLEQLRKLEARVFGSTSGKSPVVMRVREKTIILGEQIQPITPGLTYLACQSLFNFRGRLNRGCFMPHSKFTINFLLRRNSQSLRPIIEDTFWLLANFGGLGARTRRGFGGFRITNSQVSQAINTDCYTTKITDIRKHFTEFAQSNHALDNSKGTPQAEFSSFVREQYQLKVITKDGNWNTILTWCGKTLRNFRAPIRTKKPYNITVDYQSVVKKFIDTDASGQSKNNEFKLAIKNKQSQNLQNDIFGLPYQINSLSSFRGRSAKLQWRKKDDGDNDRRSSPLFIRPIHLTDDRWAIVFLIFKARFLPNDSTMELEASELKLRDTDNPWSNSQKPSPIPISLPVSYRVLENFLDHLDHFD